MIEFDYDDLDEPTRELLDALEHRSIATCELLGGYPDDTAVLGEYLVIATLDAGKEMNAPVLECRRLSESLEKFTAAKALVASGECEDIVEALEEVDF